MAEPACATVNPRVFDSLNHRVKAKKICHGCPVIDACRERHLQLEKGYPISARYGTIAALTPTERFELDRERWADAVPVGGRPGRDDIEERAAV